MQNDAPVSLWLKAPYTLCMAFMIPVYWIHHGPTNLLWGSDIAIITMLFAVLLHSSLLASVMAVSVLVGEFAWNIDFLGRLLFGIDAVPGPGTAYMWDASQPLWLRLVSLFHVALPVLLLWSLYRFGYDRRALLWGTLFAWVILPVSWFVGGPEKNINWTYGFGSEPQAWVSQPAYLAIIMVAFPLCVFLPTHLLLRRLFPAT